MSTTPDAAPLYKRLEALAQQFAEKAWEDPKAPNSAFLQDHAYSLSEFARQAELEALEDGESMTAAQQRRVARTLASSQIEKIAFGYRPFDLPDRWIDVAITYANGHTVVGGISPEGDMHT